MRPSQILYTLAAFLLLSVVAAPVSAQSAEAEIRGILKERDASIKALLGPAGSDVPAPKQERLRNEINDFVDFRAMAQAALGTHWSKLTPSQREEFVTVFSDIVRGQSLANLDPYRAPVTYEAIRVNGNEAQVVTTTVIDEVPMTVEYRLHKTGGDWLATDIILDEVSTVEGYSRSFQTMIRKRGFDTLMDRLKARRDEMAS